MFLRKKVFDEIILMSQLISQLIIQSTIPNLTDEDSNFKIKKRNRTM